MFDTDDDDDKGTVIAGVVVVATLSSVFLVSVECVKFVLCMVLEGWDDCVSTLSAPVDGRGVLDVVSFASFFWTQKKH